MADDELKLMISKLADPVESERVENAKFRTEMRAGFRVIHARLDGIDRAITYPMTTPRSAHPCFQYCDIDPAVGRCHGCGHKFEEVLTWGQLSPERRDEAEREARAFLGARGRPGYELRKDHDES